MDDHVLFFLLRRMLLPAASVLIVLIVIGALMLFSRVRWAWTRRSRAGGSHSAAPPADGQLSNGSPEQGSLQAGLKVRRQ